MAAMLSPIAAAMAMPNKDIQIIPTSRLLLLLRGRRAPVPNLERPVQWLVPATAEISEPS
jgi:hypothetical protein